MNDGPSIPPATSPEPGKLTRWWQLIKPLLGMRGSSLKESIEELIEEQSADGDLKQEEKDILLNLAGFGDLRVSDVMTPRADVIAMDIGTTFDELKSVIHKEGHTRYPIYRSTLDDVVGFVHLKDLVPQLCKDVPYNLRAAVHQVMFVPPSMPVVDLLVKMRAARAHMSLVVDEFGGTAGLVTLEDIVEEIVGDIEDEHDEEETLLIRNVNGTIDASARINMEDLEKELGIRLGNDGEREYDTLAGFMFEYLGRVPAVGEILYHPTGFELEVKDGDMRRIKRVIVRKPHQPEQPDGDTTLAA